MPFDSLCKNKIFKDVPIYENIKVDKQMYLDAESQLTISDFKEVEKNLKVLSAKNSQLEEKFNDLLAYLRTNSIEVPNFQKWRKK